MAQDNQQQQGQQQQDQQQQGQQQQDQQQAQQGQQQQGQQQASPLQLLGRALSDIRRVQSLLELNYPDQGEAIQMQREAGDIVWAQIQRMQQQAQQQQGQQ
jgi:Ca-activated chloride channel family protein